MPKKFDNLKFQESHFGLVGQSEVDPGSDETADDILPAVDTASATKAGFASTSEERVDRLSRTHAGNDELILRGEERVNSPNAQFDATKRRLSKQKEAQRQIEEMRKAFVAAYTP